MRIAPPILPSSQSDHPAPSILVRDSGYRWMRNVGHVIALKSERS